MALAVLRLEFEPTLPDSCVDLLYLSRRYTQHERVVLGW